MNGRGRRRTHAVSISLVLLLVAISGVFVWADHDFDNWVTSYDTVSMGPHTIVFYGRSYDAVNDESTWYYLVTSGSSPAISHWVLGLCVGHTVNDAGPGTWVVGLDQNKKGNLTGVYGVKWESGLDDDEVVQHSVTLDGNWDVEDVEVGIKAGGDIYTDLILGPSCTPPAEISVEVSGLAPLTIDQPLIGDWAGGGGSFIASLGDLTVEVTVSGSATYAASVSYTLGPGSNPASPSFSAVPLSFEYPTGVWTDIPAGPGSVTLPGLSGTDTEVYPIRVNLDSLGDRRAGDVIEFQLTVTVTSNI